MPKGVYVRTEKAREACRNNARRPRPGQWKGDDAGYTARHHWVWRYRGPAAEHLCVVCLGPAKQWANISGEYLRDLDDFQPMCIECHWWFDRA